MVEVMIAMVMLGVVSSATYGVIRMGTRAWRTGGIELVWAQEGQRALRQLTRDLSQVMTARRMTDRQLPPGETDSSRAPVKFLGQNGTVECFALDPFPIQGVSALVELRYKLVDRTLIRQWFAQFAPSPEQASSVEEALSDVSVFGMEYESMGGEWQEEWTTPEQMPRAVRIRIERDVRRPGRTAEGEPNVQRQVLTAFVRIS